jgi:predicted restriction endonuclease
MKKYSLPKKSGRNFCDELWRKLIQIEYNNKCPICSHYGIPSENVILNAHHLISRRVFKYRWDTDNGILICPKHHEFDLHISAHTAPWGFEDWVKENLPKKI